MTAEEVKSALDQKETGIGLATVYRNLNLLVQEGVIRKYTGEGYNFYDGNLLHTITYVAQSAER